jgi:hypothetical protein
MKKWSVEEMKTKAVLTLSVVTCMAGCAPSEAIRKLEAPAVNIVSKNVKAPQVRRVVTVPVETFIVNEATSAACLLDSPFYTAQFQAPANLMLPDYGPETPAITVSCKTADRAHTRTIFPENKDATNAGTVGVLLLGPIGAAIAAGAVAKGEGEQFYRRIVLTLRQTKS